MISQNTLNVLNDIYITYKPKKLLSYKDRTRFISITHKPMNNEMKNTKDFKFIKVIDNAKRPAECWRKNKKYIYTGEPTTKNWGVLTGKINKIFVLDLDTAKWTGDKCKSMTEGKHPFIEKFGTDYATTFNTYTIRTRSGGGHLYFKYDKNMSKNRTCAHHQIDIRSDGGLVVAPGSQVDGGKYEVELDTDIKECPAELMSWIQDQICEKNYRKKPNYKATKKEKKVNKTIKNINKKYSENPTDNRMWIYNISDAEVLKVVSKLPSDYLNNYEDWLKLTTFFKILNRKELWVQVCKTGENYNAEKNQKVWDGCDAVNYEIVKHIFYTANCGDIIPYIKYKPLLKEVIQPTTIINRTKLGRIDNDGVLVKDTELEKVFWALNKKHPELSGCEIGEQMRKTYGDERYDKYMDEGYFTEEEQVDFFYDLQVLPELRVEDDDGLPTFTDRKYKVVKSDTGTGKTTAFRKYAKNHNKKFISIVSRRSLGTEQYNSFNYYGLDCAYYDISFYMRQGQNYITTIDSFFKYCKDIDFSDYVIFCDEWSSIVAYLIDASTLQSNRIITLQFLIHALEECEEAIFVDADINDTSLLFIQDIVEKDEEMLFIKNEYIHNKGVPAREYKDEKVFEADLRKLDKWILCCDSKAIADDYFHMLDDPTIKLYTSDNDEHLNMDGYDKIIYSPKIIYGLDSVMKRQVFCIYKEHTINPKNMLQQISRCRNIIQLNYLFTKKSVSKPRFKELTDCVEWLMEGNKKSVSEFGFLTSDKINELYLHLLGRIEFNNDAYNTNKFAHFIRLLKARGFIGNILYVDTIFNEKKHKATSAEIRAEREKNFDPTTKQNKRINEYLQLPDDETIIKHKNLFLDGRELEEHFRISDYFYKEQKDILEKLNTTNKDFNIKTIRSMKSKVYYLQKLTKVFNNKDWEKKHARRPDILTPITDKKKSKSIQRGYEVVFDTKLPKPYDLSITYDCDRFLNKIYNKLFSSVLVKDRGLLWELPDGKIKKGYKWEINPDKLKTHEEIYKHRKINTAPINFLTIDGEDELDAFF